MPVNMKHFILFLFITLSCIALQAQIAEVKVEGSYAKIYNDKGQYTGSSVYKGNNTLEGYNNEYIVIKEGSYAKIYDAKGHYTGSSIYIGNNTIKHVSQTAILVKEGSYVKYYDFKGHYTGNSTYEPK
jgi:hypothetical protein